MDSTDTSILLELTNNCRVSFLKLAKKFSGLSLVDIGNRVNALVKNHVILKFTVVPSMALWKDAQKAIIIFRTYSSRPIVEEKITLLGINPCVSSISIGNQTEGFAIVYYRSQEELNDVYDYFVQFHPSFKELTAFPVQYLTGESLPTPTKDILDFEKLDWLILTHLREQGRLSLERLSNRIKFPPERIANRLEFLRSNHLIEETIQINPAKSQRETWTIFKLELTLVTRPGIEELMRQLESTSSFWRPSCWKVNDENIVLLGFLCESYTDVEKTQSWLLDIPGVKSIDKIMGGSTYYFPDFRDELIEEKRSHGWFSPELWVVK